MFALGGSGCPIAVGEREKLQDLPGGDPPSTVLTLLKGSLGFSINFHLKQNSSFLLSHFPSIFFLTESFLVLKEKFNLTMEI